MYEINGVKVDPKCEKCGSTHAKIKASDGIVTHLSCLSCGEVRVDADMSAIKAPVG
ncbi:hypothetical protein DSM25558_4966 [Agrobacterium sp. DSM 25558]|nr:hypothetical protein DSM25558_4966 [Agrobacterium sp. DSM 25558]